MKAAVRSKKYEARDQNAGEKGAAVQGGENARHSLPVTCFSLCGRMQRSGGAMEKIEY